MFCDRVDVMHRSKNASVIERVVSGSYLISNMLLRKVLMTLTLNEKKREMRCVIRKQMKLYCSLETII
jgi:hypothetical protein